MKNILRRAGIGLTALHLVVIGIAIGGGGDDGKTEQGGEACG